MIALIYTCSNNVQEFPFLHTFPVLITFVHRYPHWGNVVAHCGFDQYFPNDYINTVNVVHLLLQNVWLDLLAIQKAGWFIFILWDFGVPFIVQKYTSQIFSSICRLSPTLLIASLIIQKHFSVMCSCFHFLCFESLLQRILDRSSVPKHPHVASPNNLIVLFYLK